MQSDSPARNRHGVVRDDCDDRDHLDAGDDRHHRDHRIRSQGDTDSLLVDLLLAIGTTAVIGFLIALGFGGDRPADAIAYAFAVGFGAVLLLRRRMPRVVLAMSILALFAYYALDYPTIGVAVPVLAALFAAADRGAVAWAIGGAAVVSAATTYFRFRAGEPLDYLLGYETVSNAALMAAAILLGVTLRGRRQRARQQVEIDRLVDEQRRTESTAAARDERERLAHELHDTIGHSLTVVSMHASAGAEAIGRDDAAAADAFERIRDSANGALREVRSIRRALRDAGDLTTSSLADAPQLFDRIRATGLTIDATLEADPGELSTPVDRAAFRIVQESLTNVVRHANARRAEVSTRVDDGVLVVRVADDGDGTGDAHAPDSDGIRLEGGTGIAGMRERARVLGGTLETATGDGGFVVTARMPARMDP